MSELAGILGLVFVVILFNFSYPQSAMDLLLKATDYYFSMKTDKLTPEHHTLLLNVKGWFFLTDMLQFLVTYFIGIFAIIFLAIYYLPNSLNIVAIFLSILGILFYIIMLIKSVIRIITFDDKNRFINRREWFCGKGIEKPFNSKIPMVEFILVSIITVTTLVVSTFIGLCNYSLSDSVENNRIISLGFAIMVVVIVYLLNFWGAYIYMPVSSTGMLCYLSGIGNTDSH